MKNLKLALDWTPNINHIGFFVALENGYYKDESINFEIIDPQSDNYQKTPAKKLEHGEVDLALCPTESVISYQTKKEPFPMIAIAAILQEDLSAITVKSNSGINSPKDLDGKIYASYEARYEDEIVKEMIKNDGGKGVIKIEYPNKLGIWNILLNGKADATWIFLNWEGVEAETSYHELKYFKMKDYHIPYSYSPIIAANAKNIESNKDLYRAFLRATKKGFLETNINQERSIKILKDKLPEKDKHIDLKLALKMSSEYFGDKDSWGIIKEKSMKNFLDWINNKGLEKSRLDLEDIYTNSCLP